jgi:cytochrome c-type biogenesis protein
METMLLQTSLIAAFVAGIVALFAPCCITFLLPAYLGNVFKEKEKVLLMTLIFASGIFIVMMPAVLGIALLSKALFEYHKIIYYIGGIVMLGVAAIAFLGIKLPMIQLPGRDTTKTDPLSIFTLGIFSGITSACCAPVLIGILALTFLSPSFFGALSIGGMYVIGMVTPLLIISLFLQGRVSKFALLKKPVMKFMFLKEERVITMSNFIAGWIFLLTGLFIVLMNASGKLGMGGTDGFTKMIQTASYTVNQFVGNNVLLNVLFVFLIIFALYRIVKKM